MHIKRVMYVFTFLFVHFVCREKRATGHTQWSEDKQCESVFSFHPVNETQVVKLSEGLSLLSHLADPAVYGLTVCVLNVIFHFM